MVSPILKGCVIMGLFLSFGERKNKNKNSIGERLDRLTPEGELPFGWTAYNQAVVKKMDDDWLLFRLRIDNAKEPLEKRTAMKSFLLFLEDGKKHYYGINECAGKYFEYYICNTPYTATVKNRLKELEKQLKKK